MGRGAAPEPGWLGRQLKAIKEDEKTWPGWMKSKPVSVESKTVKCDWPDCPQEITVTPYLAWHRDLKWEEKEGGGDHLCPHHRNHTWDDLDRARFAKSAGVFEPWQQSMISQALDMARCLRTHEGLNDSAEALEELAGEVERQQALLGRCLAIIADAIVHGMPLTEEVAAVRNEIASRRTEPY